MTTQNRQYLKDHFKDGERPSGEDFADLMDSFVHQSEDGLELESDALVLPGGIQLQDSDDEAAPGTLRFHDGELQFYDGNWHRVPAVIFQPTGDGGALVYDGNVGIGLTEAPGYRLEVELSEEEGVRLGNAVCSDGPDQDEACFFHRTPVAEQGLQESCALRQLHTGEVRLNAPNNRRIRFMQNGDQTRLAVSREGPVVVGAGSIIPIAPEEAVFQVNGSAFKTDGTAWSEPSDARVKEDVRDLEAGLEQLREVRPVRFRYNGKAGTPAGREGVGVLGQEIEQVFPEMVKRAPARPQDGLEGDGLRVYNGSAMTYVLINAVKELAAKVEHLEAALAAAGAPSR